MSDDRTAAIYELTRTAYEALGDGFVRLGADANEALSALTFHLAEAAVHNEVEREDFLEACQIAWEQARELATKAKA